jgi:flagellar motor switch/type III secretory pathway protein FliN
MASTAVAPKPEPVSHAEDTSAWRYVGHLPCHLTVDLPVPKFTVGNLAGLEKDSIVDSRWNVTQDVPLRANGELIALSEFEVLGDKLAVRVTELA